MHSNERPSRAQLERDHRRKLYYQRLKANALKKENTFNDSGGFFDSAFSVWKMRRLAPIAFLIYVFLILFTFGWLITKSSVSIDTAVSKKLDNGLIPINIPQGNKLYHFNIDQSFSNKTPEYSELEIELLDKNYNHIYSVGKNLWQEQYPGENGGLKLYHDRKIKFDLELKNKGIYYIRGISYNGNNGGLRVEVHKKTSGSLYFGFYTIIFIILTVVLIIGSGTWGTPTMMFASLKKIKNLSNNRLFSNLLISFTILFIGAVIISISHYGYASSGEDANLPTYFLSKDKEIYLG